MLVVNCREPKTLYDTQYLHLHLIRTETADMRPQHVVFTCGLKNTVKASFLMVKMLRIWYRGKVWRCLIDNPSCLCNDTLCSTNSNAGAAPAPVRADAKVCPCTRCKPDDYREVPRRLLHVLIEQLNLNKKKSEIQMLVSKLIGNRMQL